MSESRPSQRPVNLNLLRFHFPLPAVTSITHRLTGVVLFLGVWVLLYLLHESLMGTGGGRNLSETPVGKLMLLVIFAAASFHLLAGIKHLLLDLGIGERLTSARALAWGVWVLSIALTAVFAVLFLARSM